MAVIKSEYLLPNYDPEEVGMKGEKGDDGVGIATTLIEYNKSTNSTTPPSTGWTSTIPSISGGQYLWTRVTLNYTNGQTAESYTVARQGEDGADGQLFTGETEPTDFNDGDIWYKVVSGKVTGVYEAKEGVWIEVPFESSVIAETIVGKTIQASHLTGSTIDGGEITGAEINGSVINGGEFNNLFTEKIGLEATLTGNTTIQRGIIETNYTVNNTETGVLLSSGRQTWNGVNIESVQVGADGAEAASAVFGATGIDMYNKDMNSQFGRVHLDYQDLMTLPRTDIVDFNDALFGPYSGQAPAAERKMRTVQLYGAFVNKNLYNPSNPTTLTLMGTLPLGYRPPESIRFLMQGSNTARFLLDIDRDGKIYVSRMVGWTGSKYDFIPMQAGSWFNIQCNFMAATV